LQRLQHPSKTSGDNLNNLRTTIVTNQNFIHEEIKSKLNSGNVCYSSDQSLLSSRPLSIKIKKYKIIILPVVLHGCVSWSVTLREERRSKVCENIVLKKILGTTREKGSRD